MFPYPSGVWLHAGHASVFTINDVIARYKRMQWYTVLNPFWFDAFGLPTENYAMQLGKQAREVTDTNKEKFLQQVDALNMSFDLERIIDTSTPEYYKRTQRIFLKLYDAWLAYRDTLWVNRCPSCMTVLANDQVVDGKCERCKSEITQKKHPQRFIKITEYADRLIEDLDTLDRPEETKIAQKNRIGRSEWAEIDFQVVQWEKSEKITCFTTRPDTIYGVTALVLAPENALLDDLLTPEALTKVEEYRQTTLAKTAVQRQKDLKEKTWVDSGLKALHPLTNELIPIWYADYVLADYGSGAVMSVPAHDERDHEFAQKFGLEIVQVIDWKIDESKWMVLQWNLINSWEFNWLSHTEAQTSIIDYIEKLGHGRRKITYKLRDRSVSRQRYWGSPIPVRYDAEGNHHPIPESELPVVLPLDLENYQPDGKSPLEDHPSFPQYGDQWTRECDTLDTFMCSSFYFLRYPDTDNADELIRKELAEKMFPVDFYSGGKEHTVWHLLYARFIHKFLFDQWYVSSKEPFAKLVHQGMVLGADGRKMGKRYGNGVDPLEVVEKYSADAVRTYMMFMGPVESDKPWSDTALHGMAKFLRRVDALLDIERRWTKHDAVESAVHEAIKWITHDIEKLKLNTCVSKFMILVNVMYEHSAVTDEQLHVLARLIAPFATDLAEKIYTETWWEGDVHYAIRPAYDESKIVQWGIILPIQINGKVRAKIDIATGLTEDEVLELAKSQENIAKRIEWKDIKKVIWVQDKILNLIVS